MMMQQQPALTPQQAAIQELHGRFERGELSFEDFERALGKVLQAQNPEECWAILHDLPAPPGMSLSALDIPSARPAVQAPPSNWIVSLIGEVKRIRHPWRMGQQTTAIMLIGEIELDLSMAALPQRGILQINMLIGEVKIYVPRSVQVSVQTTAVIGEVNALGQKSGGIIAHSQAENYPPGMPETTTPQLEIQVNLLIGEVKVVQVDNPVIVDELRRKEARRLKWDAKQAQLPQPKQDAYL
jgi:hypothetical protein